MTEKLAEVPGAPIYIAFKVSKIKPCTIHKKKKSADCYPLKKWIPLLEADESNVIEADRFVNTRISRPRSSATAACLF